MESIPKTALYGVMNVEDLTDEFLALLDEIHEQGARPKSKVFDTMLDSLTKAHARSVFNSPGGGDDVQNWCWGEKLTALTILETHVEQCRKYQGAPCPKLPKCCDPYLAKTNIEELKRIKGYFVWNQNRGGGGDAREDQTAAYFSACQSIIYFCEKLPDKNGRCKLNEVLKKLDRRRNSSGRRLPISLNPKDSSIIPMAGERRWTKDRRICDHRGWAAAFLGA